MEDREKRGKLTLRGVHETQHVEEVYRPPQLLDFPEFDDTDQYVYRWLRVTLGGEDDIKNINLRLREGWTFVKISDLKDQGAYSLVASQKGNSLLENTVRVGDVALAKLPRAKQEAYIKHVEGLTRRQASAFAQKRVQANVDGQEIFLDAGDSRTRVTRGPVDFAD